MDERDGFYFHRSFWEAVNELPQKDQLPILRAIILFGLTGEEPEKLTPMQKGFFLLVRPVLQKGRNKASSGKKGGSKKEAKRKQTESEPESADRLPLSDNNSDKGVILPDYHKGAIHTDCDEGVNDAAASAPAPGNAFTKFWEMYPNQVNREAAWEAWKQLKPDNQTVCAIMAGLEGWKQSRNWEEEDGKYIPRAAKFLTEKHWQSPPAGRAQKEPRQPDQDEIEAVKRMMGVGG